MKQGIIARFKNRFAPKAIILMYHRIGNPESDVWELAVSPENFEQHLKLLKKWGNVVTVRQLVDDLYSGRLKKNSIAITFDDGYIDNFTTAKPLLEKYHLPATFFITSGQIESNKEFWWDELERIFLVTPVLPDVFFLTIKEATIEFKLAGEVSLTDELLIKHRSWRACSTAPPTLRSQLYYKVWEQLKPLPVAEQEACLQTIRKWAGLPSELRPDYRVMSASELKLLASNDLFTIGAHTVSHPALAHHDRAFQIAELRDNRRYLSELANRQIDLLAYPYGNYNGYTLEAAAATCFRAAFTTEEKTCVVGSRIYQLGRLQVKNVSAVKLSEQLKRVKRR